MVIDDHLEGPKDKLLLIELPVVVDVQLLEHLLCSLLCYVLEEDFVLVKVKKK